MFCHPPPGKSGTAFFYLIVMNIYAMIFPNMTTGHRFLRNNVHIGWFMQSGVCFPDISDPLPLKSGTLCKHTKTSGMVDPRKKNLPPEMNAGKK